VTATGWGRRRKWFPFRVSVRLTRKNQKSNHALAVNRMKS
jgi:hypothetical protein